MLSVYFKRKVTDRYDSAIRQPVILFLVWSKFFQMIKQGNIALSSMNTVYVVYLGKQQMVGLWCFSTATESPESYCLLY